VMSHEPQTLRLGAIQLRVAPQMSRGAAVSTLSEKLFRRKPAVEMEAGTGSETDQSELTRTIGVCSSGGRVNLQRSTPSWY
jgi:hypothetical protein